MMSNSYIFDVKLCTPIVIETEERSPIKKISEELSVDYNSLIDVLQSRKAVRLYESEEVSRSVVKFGLGNRKVVSFNAFELVGISEYHADHEENKKSKILHGSKAIQGLAFLAHVDLHVLESVQVPLQIYRSSNSRQWMDISELVYEVISRNVRLDMLIECEAPTIILVNEERILQECVTNLESNNTLKRKDGTLIRSLNDLGYSMINGWDDEPCNYEEFDEFTIEDEGGESK